MKKHLWALAGVAATVLAAPVAMAGDTISVAKSAAVAWTFTPVDIGAEQGIFKKHGFDEVKIVALPGDARMQQAFASGSIEFGLGSGPSMAFGARGAPVRAVAAFGNEPRNISIAVPYNSTIKSIDQLKGKKLSVTTAGSLTDWLPRRLAMSKGWGHEGFQITPLGNAQSSFAALKTGQIDGMVTALEFAILMESQKELRPIYVFSDLVKDFHTHVIFARLDLVEKNPDMVQRFVNAWFDTIRFIKHNKAKAVEIAARVLKTPPEIIGKVYDAQIGMLSDTGVFDPKALALLKDSYVDMQLLDKKPDDSQILTTKFVPAKH
jgi:ABC-type nitrate/sulfonate/bicarbonate transport system substrate-binding protein